MTQYIKQPQNKTFHHGSQSTALLWNPSLATKKNQEYSRAQKFVDSEVLRLSSKYTPFDTGNLYKSGIRGTEKGAGEVVWNAPYARYQYYGKLMIGKAPKTVTNRPLKYHSGEVIRGAYWFERMKSDHKKEIIAGAKRMAGGGK